jgi:hypothetical protein
MPLTKPPASQPFPLGRVVAFLVACIVAGGLIYAGVQYFVGGPSRSVAAYCKTWKDEGIKLHDKWAAQQRQAQTSDDPFGGLRTVMGAPQDLADFFAKLDKVAPDDIEPAVNRYQQAWQTTADNLGSKATDPLSFLTAQFGVMLMAGSAEQQIDTWTQQNCSTTSVK